MSRAGPPKSYKTPLQMVSPHYSHFWYKWEDGDVPTLTEAFKGAPQDCKNSAWYMWNMDEYHTAPIMKELLDIGADPNWVDCDGWSVLELVLEWGGDEACLKLLEQAGATLKVKSVVADRKHLKSGYAADLLARCEIG